MFFARAASLRDRPNSLTASTVMPVRSTGCTWNSPSGSIRRRRAGRAGWRRTRPWSRLRAVKSWVSTMIAAPLGRSPRLALSAAGFIATSTSGASPAVRMSWSAKCTWNDETPGQRALGRADLGGEVRQRHQVVAEDGRLLGEPVTGQLHAVTGVAREPDDHPVELLDLLGHCAPTSLCSSRPLVPAPARRRGRPLDRTQRYAKTGTCSSFPRARPCGTVSHDSRPPRTARTRLP